MKRIVPFALFAVLSMLVGCTSLVGDRFQATTSYYPEYVSSNLVKVHVVATDMGTGLYTLEEDANIVAWNGDGGYVGEPSSKNYWTIYVARDSIPCTLTILWSDSATTAHCHFIVE